MHLYHRRREGRGFKVAEARVSYLYERGLGTDRDPSGFAVARAGKPRASPAPPPGTLLKCTAQERYNAATLSFRGMTER